jgi:putative nucleotidyltransferase with HDIG domain
MQRKLFKELYTDYRNHQIFKDVFKHSLRVKKLSLKLAEMYGIIDRKYLYHLGKGATFHDVGKLQVPKTILEHKGSLTQNMRELIKNHVKNSYDIVNIFNMNKIEKEIALYHHENWDGTGYLNGLKGNDIPVGARIIRVADVFDALISERPYREALNSKEALDIMIEERSVFDQRVLKLLFRLCTDNELEKYTYKEKNKQPVLASGS